MGFIVLHKVNSGNEVLVNTEHISMIKKCFCSDRSSFSSLRVCDLTVEVQEPSENIQAAIEKITAKENKQKAQRNITFKIDSFCKGLTIKAKKKVDGKKALNSVEAVFRESLGRVVKEVEQFTKND